MRKKKEFNKKKKKKFCVVSIDNTKKKKKKKFTREKQKKKQCMHEFFSFEIQTKINTKETKLKARMTRSFESYIDKRKTKGINVRV